MINKIVGDRMAAIGQRCGTTATTVTTAITSTDTSNMYWCDDYYIISTTDDDIPKIEIEKEIRKESLQIPAFKVVRKLHNTKKVKTFVEKRQLNFHIRNAL